MHCMHIPDQLMTRVPSMNQVNWIQKRNTNCYGPMPPVVLGWLLAFIHFSLQLVVTSLRFWISGTAELVVHQPVKWETCSHFFCFEEQNYKLRFLLTSLFVGLNQVILTISFILFHLYENNTWFNLRAKIDQQHYYDYRCKSPDYRSTIKSNSPSWVVNLSSRRICFLYKCLLHKHTRLPRY